MGQALAQRQTAVQSIEEAGSKPIAGPNRALYGDGNRWSGKGFIARVGFRPFRPQLADQQRYTAETVKTETRAMRATS